MRAPRSRLCTVRSKVVLVVVVLVSTFMLFDSYTWQLLPLSWFEQGSSFRRSQFETPTPAQKLVSPDPSISSASERISGKSSRSEDDHDDEGEITDNPYTAKDNIKGESQPTEEKAGEASSTQSRTGRVPGPQPLAFQDGGAAGKSGTGKEKELLASHKLPTSDNMDTSTVYTTQYSDNEKLGETEAKEQNPPFNSSPHIKANGSFLEDENDSTREGKPGSPLRGEISETALIAAAVRLVTPSVMTNVLQPIVKKQTYDELSNLQKVEFDLWQARAAMKKVVVAQINTPDGGPEDAQSPDGEPWGDVYRNAAVFRQSYREMEKRFKIFAYQEGEQPLVHTGPCKEIYSVEGRFIQELQADNPFLTFDPEVAHAFFLPFSVAMMVTYLYTANSGDMSPLLRYVKDYVHVVSNTYPYWTRSEGADHFMLSCHDWGPHVSRADKDLVSKTIRVLCNANLSEGYVPTKDASLPEINLVGGEIPAELGGLPVQERPSLAFFAGADHGPVRPDLFKYWEGKDESIHVYHQVPMEGQSYHEYMKSTKYCLCPGGYEVNSPRIVEAIYNDCVPVVIADNFVLPFSDVLNWETFSVHVLEKDISSLKTILEAIPLDRYVDMQAKVKQVRHHFLLNQPPARYDVFHMILHSVWLRRINIQLVE